MQAAKLLPNVKPWELIERPDGGFWQDVARFISRVEAKVEELRK